jgi:hypothetical protein
MPTSVRAAAALLCLGLGGCIALALAPKALKALALLLLLCLALRQLLHLPQLCIACGRGQAYLGASCFRSVLALASRVRDEDKVIMTVKVTGAVAAPPIKVRPAPRGMFMAFTAPLATCHLASLAFVLCLLVLCLLPFTVSLAAIYYITPPALCWRAYSTPGGVSAQVNTCHATWPRQRCCESLCWWLCCCAPLASTAGRPMRASTP